MFWIVGFGVDCWWFCWWSCCFGWLCCFCLFLCCFIWVFFGLLMLWWVFFIIGCGVYEKGLLKYGGFSYVLLLWFIFVRWCFFSWWGLLGSFLDILDVCCGNWCNSCVFIYCSLEVWFGWSIVGLCCFWFWWFLGYYWCFWLVRFSLSWIDLYWFLRIFFWIYWLNWRNWLVFVLVWRVYWCFLVLLFFRIGCGFNVGLYCWRCCFVWLCLIGRCFWWCFSGFCFFIWCWLLVYWVCWYMFCGVCCGGIWVFFLICCY